MVGCRFMQVYAFKKLQFWQNLLITKFVGIEGYPGGSSTSCGDSAWWFEPKKIVTKIFQFYSSIKKHFDST